MTERQTHLKAILELVPPVWRQQAADAIVALVTSERARERAVSRVILEKLRDRMDDAVSSGLLAGSGFEGTCVDTLREVNKFLAE